MTTHKSQPEPELIEGEPPVGPSVAVGMTHCARGSEKERLINIGYSRGYLHTNDDGIRVMTCLLSDSTRKVFE